MTFLEIPANFENLLTYIRQNRGFDFTGYKRSTLVRRVTKRLQTLSIEHFSDYIDYLEVHPEEFNYLFNTILINVTDFFRDVAAWEYLEKQIIPNIIKGKKIVNRFAFGLLVVHREQKLIL
jgi:two-component system CheB/CheR fusion protein